MKTLVVGSRGFIGSHLDFEADKIDLEDGVDFLTHIPRRYKTIVFLAADLKFTREAYLYNRELYERLDKYRRLYPKTHVIYTSSAFVYGNSYDAKETDLPAPTHIYGQSKLLGEYYVRRFKNHTILRLSNVYGPGGHSAIEKFLAGSQIIHGNGLQIRDFVPVEYVTDCIKRCVEEKVTGVYNISSGVGQTILDLYKQFGSGKYALSKNADYGLNYIVLNNSKWRKLCE